jgi:uncharacterized protein
MIFFRVAAGIGFAIWQLFSDAAFYVLFGLAVAGVVQALVRQEYIVAHLGKPGIRSVLMAALLGIPLPLCSCGVIPTAVSLRKNGASKGATVSFLVATPESGIDSIAVSYALLDPLMTVFRPVAGLVTAVFAGICENFFGTRETGPAKKGEGSACAFCNLTDAHTHSAGERLRLGIAYAFTDLLCDISAWLAIGIVAGGAIAYFVPSSVIGSYLGYSFPAYVIALIAGIPMYICASASTPIAAALIAKGMSPGAALVFLLVGPATNIATILTVSRFLGKRSAVIYLFSIASFSVLAGVILNAIYRIGSMDIRAHIGAGGEFIPGPVRALSAALLIFFMIRCRMAGRRHCRG